MFIKATLGLAVTLATASGALAATKATQVVPTAEHPDRMLMAAVAFTSEHNAVCYLPAHRIC